MKLRNKGLWIAFFVLLISIGVCNIPVQAGGGPIPGCQNPIAGPNWPNTTLDDVDIKNGFGIAVGDTSSRTLPFVIKLSNGNWSQTSTPSEFNSYRFTALDSVSVISSTDAWAAGYFNRAMGTGYEPTAWHWNGSIWQVSILPSLPVGTILGGIDAVNANDVWVAGTYLNTMSPVVLHFNGTNWVTVSPPPLGFLMSISVFDNSVWVSDNAGRVAEYVSGTWNVTQLGGEVLSFDASTNLRLAGDINTLGLIGIYTATQWLTTTFDGPGEGPTQLWDIHETADEDVWATGWYSGAGNIYPLLVRETTSGYMQFPMPGLPHNLGTKLLGISSYTELGLTYIWSVGWDATGTAVTVLYKCGTPITPTPTSTVISTPTVLPTTTRTATPVLTATRTPTATATPCLNPNGRPKRCH